MRSSIEESDDAVAGGPTAVGRAFTMAAAAFAGWSTSVHSRPKIIQSTTQQGAGDAEDSPKSVNAARTARDRRVKAAVNSQPSD